ncbi:unnamed protein product, partial [Rotaria sp. Silwood1]
FNVNFVINGDFETGPCEADNGIIHPTFWNYTGAVTQTYYNNSLASVLFGDPGPSDRGRCYFNGQISLTTNMSQTINLIVTASSILIDTQTVWFNLSVWIGGWSGQDDNAALSLTFINQANQQVGNITTIGPVYAADRSAISSLLFRAASGLAPIGSCSAIYR